MLMTTAVFVQLRGDFSRYDRQIPLALLPRCIEKPRTSTRGALCAARTQLDLLGFSQSEIDQMDAVPAEVANAYV